MSNKFRQYGVWRREDPEYRWVMTDIGRSFLMREMRLRRVPGMWRLQSEFRAWWPAQRKNPNCWLPAWLEDHRERKEQG